LVWNIKAANWGFGVLKRRNKSPRNQSIELI
jgi:hypothetical protein